MDSALIELTLSEILKQLNLSFVKIEVSTDEELTRVDIESDDPSRIIGWHGETLNAIQHLVKAIVRSQERLERSPFIVLDVDGYRRAQEEKVCRIAEQKADFVRRTGSRVALAPMSPYFRRIVHMHVTNSHDLQDLTTESAGEGDYRQVVLRLKEEKGSISKDEEGELSPVLEEETSTKDDGLENLDV
ncbi:KH domain-containing protein [Patescibacteria group bacterium]|nr:KH domain-containing protein [Patescibacteria group bacterium]MBU2259343.1 KH domain-containing protein [Patescibacteria group bacterium]